MNRRPTALSQFRALYVAAVAVILLGAFGVVFVPRAHAATSMHPLHVAAHVARVASSTDVAPVAGLFGIGCLSLAGLLSLTESKS